MAGQLQQDPGDEPLILHIVTVARLTPQAGWLIPCRGLGGPRAGAAVAGAQAEAVPLPDVVLGVPQNHLQTLTIEGLQLAPTRICGARP